MAVCTEELGNPPLPEGRESIVGRHYRDAECGDCLS